MTTNEQPPDYKKEAMNIVDDLITSDKGYDIFRGQPRAGLALLPKAMRKEFENGDHLEALAKFRRDCSAYGMNPTNSLEDLAIAQHYGLATHLLDWTTNPLVAIFFACEEATDEKGKPAAGEVLVLNKPEALKNEDIKGDNWQYLEKTLLYNPRLVDPRIVRQKALFTIQGLKSKALKDQLSRHELVEGSVPAELKKPLREILYCMGIDCFLV